MHVYVGFRTMREKHREALVLCTGTYIVAILDHVCVRNKNGGGGRWEEKESTEVQRGSERQPEQAGLLKQRRPAAVFRKDGGGNKVEEVRQ